MCRSGRSASAVERATEDVGVIERRADPGLEQLENGPQSRAFERDQADDLRLPILAESRTQTGEGLAHLDQAIALGHVRGESLVDPAESGLKREQRKLTAAWVFLFDRSDEDVEGLEQRAPIRIERDRDRARIGTGRALQ